MITFAAALFLGASAGAAGSASVSQGRAAYDLNQLAKAEQIYASVAADRAQPAEERARANIELARIAWLIDGNAPLALTRASAARATGAKLCESGQMEARILREAGRLTTLAARAPALTRACADDSKRDEIALEAIKGRLDRAAATPRLRADELSAATAMLNRLSPHLSDSLDAAAARLEIGLLNRNAQAALIGWRDYFWLTSNAGPPALATYGPAKLFTTGLARSASQSDKIDLLYLLIRAGFSDQARRFAAVARVRRAPASPKWRTIEAYWQQRDALTAAALRMNRSLARGGRRDDPALQKAAFQSLGALMAASGAKGDPRQAVLANYGIIGSVGLTSGYPSLHIGHVIEDRTETVRQYGHEAKVRFAAIDNLWANGFEGWLWDGAAETGGWSGDDIIVHVRPAYTSGPASAFVLVGNTVSRRDLLSQLPRLEAADVAQALAGRSATLEGLNTRLRLQVVDQVARHARRSAPAAAFRRAFLSEYWRGSLQHSIFIHEGRHAIDKAMNADGSKLDNMTLEYQANLSELSLADYPRMALMNLNRGIGGTSPHERASTRILASYAAWVGAHGPEVRRYDPQTPPEVQIDKLTDAQIRAIAQSLDPLAARSHP